MESSSEDAARWQRQFGSHVRGLREAASITQAALADAAQMHVTYLSGVERGKRNVSLINIVRLARALQMPPGDLLRGIDP